METSKYGHICGRFQPFHKQHLEYAKLALEQTEIDALMIGVTNADPHHITPEDKDEKRHEKKHNPFRFYERLSMIEATIEKSEISVPVQILPFPINKPDLWQYYAPKSALYCIGMVDKWNEEKASRIEKTGREVRRIEMNPYLDGEKVRATKIRKNIAKDKEWKHLVPEPVSEYIERNKLDRRIKRLYEG